MRLHPGRSAALLLAVTLATATATSAAGEPVGGATSPSPSAGTSVTLITGDVVDVSTAADGTLAVAVRQADGATGGVQTQQLGDDLYVIPDSALPYLASGALDRRLFNVSHLIEIGYDDARRDAVPLIVEYASAPTARSFGAALPGVEDVVALPSIDGQALGADKDQAASFWAAVSAPDTEARSFAGGGGFGQGIEKIWLDGQVTGYLDVSVPQVGAPQAWAAGYDGTGATVAVLDTGIDVTHPDVADAIAEAVSFVPGEEVTDPQGHGTHVASTVAGSGAASDGAYPGVAPGAELLIGKVLGDDGYGQDSWIIAGMEWAAQRADVVSMSLGDDMLNDGTDPMAQALTRISEESGTLFVVAAGNSYYPGSLGSPGTSDAALTVGAVDDLDQRADFSSQGPRAGDHGLKPDLAAPGVEITAARSQTSAGEGWYQTMSGTSMAAPHVAGAAAILAASHPQWRGQRLKEALVSSTAALAGTTPYQVGSGRLWIPGALDGVDASGSQLLGSYDYPHDGDEPVSRTVTYTNDTAADVTLDLDADLVGPDGASNPLALSATQVLVPAHGTATVTFTADADDLPGTGQFTGAIVGTDLETGVTVRTATALVKEPERYDLDVTVLDRAGAPAVGSIALYRYGTDYVIDLPVDPSTGAVPTQRLEPGVYVAMAFLKVAGVGGDGSKGVALVGNPHLVIDGSDTSIVLDARAANPITLRTPKESEPSYRRLQFFHDSGTGGPYGSFSAAYQAPADVDSMFAAPTGPVAGGQYDFAVRWRTGEPLLDLVATTPRRTAISPVYQSGSTRLDGRVRLSGVFVGTGSADEYAGVDVAGKAVLVTRSDAVDPLTRATTAAEHGAALLVVVADAPGTLVEWVGGVDLPVVSVPADEGAGLVAAAATGRLSIQGDALEFPTYLYDVAKSYPGAIPGNLALAPRDRDLATVTNRFTDTSERLAWEARYDCRSYQWPPCLAVPEPQGTASTRTDYVSTYAGNTWYQDVWHSSGWEQRGTQESLTAGSRTTVDWFAPVTAPHTGAGYWLPSHTGTWFTVNVPLSSGRGGITGSYDWGSVPTTSRLYAGDQLLGESPDQAVYEEVPEATGVQSYRFTQDVGHDGSLWAYSTRSRSDWTFVADQADASDDGMPVVLPLLQVGYDVDTALDGTVRAGRSTTVGLTAAFPEGALRGGSVRGTSLEVSYDGGTTWSTVRVRPERRGDGWTADLSVPRRNASSVSLRVAAWDDGGNRVSQEVIDAFGVR
ncbi:S8 family serine peptidase [Cellulomonas humilata]|uniref:S8 family serine peptidase n=1 Tax=Cellulomonas humilata TaxID=144055 RepID=A0A7Y6DZC6_9CELL|nr:S8 family serine peptidase [Cellulomonas humilata]NUU18967.1 S8 family serine peptidase [Cellulomonas humilata]